MPQTLLLADDSVTIQRVIELTFADEDINVVAVSDGDQAVARLDSAPPDIVLADVAMPGRNGYQVAEYIKQTPHLSHIPVLLLTGAFEPVDKAQADAAGCDGILAKPFEPQLVIGRVKELLARGAASAPAGEAAPQTAAAQAPAAQSAAAPDDPADVLAPPYHQSAPANLDAYFDRLDAAFASLDARDPQPKVAMEASERSAHAETPAAAPPSPVTYASPQVDFGGHAPADRPVSAVPTPTAPALASAPAPLEMLSLDEAFAALLAAEQGVPAPSVPAGQTVPSGGTALAITDQIIEEVARRVLERLSDRVVRETVADIAERAVRHEIERIRASIK